MYGLIKLVTKSRTQNLRQGIVMKTSFKTRVLRMELLQFCEYQYFVMKYFVINFFKFSIFFKISVIKIYTNVKTPKRKLGSFVLRYSFKFQALNLVYLNELLCDQGVLSRAYIFMGLSQVPGLA